MKKMILYTLVTICAFHAGAHSFGAGSEAKQTSETIVLTKSSSPGSLTKTRSVERMEVSAFMDCESGQIEVTFEEPIGNATVCILNEAGQVISSYTCNTEAEWLVYLPLPASEGFFFLHIESSIAVYTGGFL